MTDNQTLTVPGRQSPGLLTVPQLASHLNVSQAAVRKWLLEGKLPAVRLGKAVRFDLAEVMERFAVRR